MAYKVKGLDFHVLALNVTRTFSTHSIDLIYGTGFSLATSDWCVVIIPNLSISILIAGTKLTTMEYD